MWKCCDTFGWWFCSPCSVSPLLLLSSLHSDIKPHFSNPPNERIWSESIVSPLKIGMKEKAASQMREKGENPMMREREGETGRHIVHKIWERTKHTWWEKRKRQREGNQWKRDISIWDRNSNKERKRKIHRIDGGKQGNEERDVFKKRKKVKRWQMTSQNCSNLI